MIDKLTPPPDWKLVNIDHCCACGIPKKEKNKPECVVYGSLVNGGRHQYKEYQSPEDLAISN